MQCIALGLREVSPSTDPRDYVLNAVFEILGTGYGQVLTIHAKRPVVILGVTLAWVGCLFYLILVPNLVSRLPRIPGLDLDSVSFLGHFGTGIVLGALIYLMASSGRLNVFGRARAVVAAAGVTAALGLGFEGLQLLIPDRGGQLSDVLFTLAGASVGAAIIFTLDQLKVSRSFLALATEGLTFILILLVGIGAVVWRPAFL